MALALGSQREMTAEFSREKGEPGLMDYLSKPVLLIEQKWRKRKAILSFAVSFIEHHGSQE